MLRSYFALKVSSERNTRTLQKFCAQYAQVLARPVTSVLKQVAEASGFKDIDPTSSGLLPPSAVGKRSKVKIKNKVKVEDDTEDANEDANQKASKAAKAAALEVKFCLVSDFGFYIIGFHCNFCPS